MAIRIPFASSVVSAIARKSGKQLVDTAVANLMPEPAAKRSLARRLVGAALVRVATRAVPGAIVVGGGMLARAIHRKRKEARAKQAAENVARKRS